MRSVRAVGTQRGSGPVSVPLSGFRNGESNNNCDLKEELTMNFSGFTVRRTGRHLGRPRAGGLAGATIAAPTAAAAPVGCSAGELFQHRQLVDQLGAPVPRRPSWRRSGGDGRAQPTTATARPPIYGATSPPIRRSITTCAASWRQSVMCRSVQRAALPLGLASAYDEFMAG